MAAVRPLSAGREPALGQAVGNTPLLPVEHSRGRGRLWLKAEWLNPGGSVKDRAARAILRDALRRGDLPRHRLLDASSGNTGIAYAMLGAAAGVDGHVSPPAHAIPARGALLLGHRARGGLSDRLAGTDRAVPTCA